MPQGRRKTPFSGQQKKEQLRERREERRARSRSQASGDSDVRSRSSRSQSKRRGGKNPEQEPHSEGLTSLSIAKINSQPDDRNRDANRYALHFFRESDEELIKRKKEATNPFTSLPEEDLEVSSTQVWPETDIGLPKRPPWDFSMSPVEVDRHEQEAFKQFLESIESRHGSLTALSHFELNLETWRQLWRVTEMADIVLLITDIRHPVFHFPPALYEHVVNFLKKEFILVLNKADLIPPHLVVAWIHYFKKTYPTIHVVPFASYAGMKVKTSKTKSKRFGNLKMASEASKSLYDVCASIVGDKVSIGNWLEKINQELGSSTPGDEDTSDELHIGQQVVVKKDTSFHSHEKYKDGILTIGCVGHPNVGKSSVLNALMGKKVVSVSRTPGHTKYFQTIFITPTVKLVDCPGLVFPSKIPKPMQVLMGCFPIAQLREPYSAVQYLAQRMDLPKILSLTHPDAEGSKKVKDTPKWTAYDICEAWAAKRGFRTAKAARPDTYRSANHLLRMSLDGRTLCLAFYPPGFIKQKSFWEAHPDVKSIQSLQALTGPKLADLSDLDDEVSNDGDIGHFKVAGDEVSSTATDSDHDVASTHKRQPRVMNKFALLDDDE